MWDSDVFKFQNTIQVPWSTLEIDEIDPDNKAICRDLVIYGYEKDAYGLNKYYIENGELHVRENWQQTPQKQ